MYPPRSLIAWPSVLRPTRSRGIGSWLRPARPLHDAAAHPRRPMNAELAKRARLASLPHVLLTVGSPRIGVGSLHARVRSLHGEGESQNDQNSERARFGP